MKTYFPYNPLSAMTGPFPLDSATILRIVPRKQGVYILSSTSNLGVYLACYVGRAEDLEQRLLQHAALAEYSYMYYRETGSEALAYSGECNEFHRYGRSAHLDNIVHPAKPSLYYSCPVCRQ